MLFTSESKLNSLRVLKNPELDISFFTDKSLSKKSISPSRLVRSILLFHWIFKSVLRYEKSYGIRFLKNLPSL